MNAESFMKINVMNILKIGLCRQVTFLTWES